MSNFLKITVSPHLVLAVKEKKLIYHHNCVMAALREPYGMIVVGFTFSKSVNLN